MTSMKSSLAILAVASLGLAACTNPDGTTNQTGTGAALGGLLGAATGAIVTDNKGRGAVVGGIIGAAAGAGIGSVLDRQASALEQDLSGSGARVINTGSQLIVQMPEAITFATESATVRQSIVDDLYAIARNLQQYPNNTVRVVGHTDNTGTSAFNRNLSRQRANAVANILRQGGVPSARIVAVGRGETAPIASNSTAAGRAQNRRVEIIITPRT